MLKSNTVNTKDVKYCTVVSSFYIGLHQGHGWVLLGESGGPAGCKGYLNVCERLYSILPNWREKIIKGWQPRNWGKTTPLSSSTHNWNAKEEFPENWNISSVKDKRPVCGEAVTPISNFFFSFISIIRIDECVAIHHYRNKFTTNETAFYCLQPAFRNYL